MFRKDGEFPLSPHLRFDAINKVYKTAATQVYEHPCAEFAHIRPYQRQGLPSCSFIINSLFRAVQEKNFIAYHFKKRFEERKLKKRFYNNVTSFYRTGKHRKRSAQNQSQHAIPFSYGVAYTIAIYQPY
jgi:hypothetical protein